MCIIRPNAEGSVEPKAVADAWEPIESSSNGVEAREDMVRCVVGEVLLIYSKRNR